MQHFLPSHHYPKLATDEAGPRCSCTSCPLASAAHQCASRFDCEGGYRNRLACPQRSGGCGLVQLVRRLRKRQQNALVKVNARSERPSANEIDGAEALSLVPRLSQHAGDKSVHLGPLTSHSCS